MAGIKLGRSRARYLLEMRTDVTVRQTGRTVVIDAKYYEETLQRYYDRRSIHSANLDQLVSYLKNLEHRGGPDATAEGMLVYPVTSQPLDVTYRIQGHKLRVYTLDLGLLINRKGHEGAHLTTVRARTGLAGRRLSARTDWQAPLWVGYRRRVRGTALLNTVEKNVGFSASFSDLRQVRAGPNQLLTVEDSSF